MSAAVRLSEVSFWYPGADQPALRNVSVEVRRGEVTALVGPVGSGTSTLLLVAGGFAPQLTGGRLDGLRKISAARVGVVLATPWTQLTGLCYSVRDEVACGPALRGIAREAVLAAAERAMGELGVAQLAQRDPATLSGGELQRVVVAGVLALEPDLLVLDDPAAELDPDGADAFYRSLPAIAERGAAVLVATSDLERLAMTGGRVLVLEAGRLVADGTPAEVLRA